MSIFNDKALKGVAEAAAKIMAETSHELKGNQHKIDANKNGKIDAHDFKLLRGKKDTKKDMQEGVKGAAVGGALGAMAGGPVGAAVGGALGHAAGEVLSSAKNKAKTMGRVAVGPSMADSKMKKEEVEQLDEVGDTPAGRKALGSYVTKAIADKTKDRTKGLRKATSRLYKDNFYGKKNEEVELDEAFPTVADAKKRMDAGKTATGSVTKTATGLVHKRDYKDDNDEDDTPKKSTGYGARQNYKRSTRVNEAASFTEMLELYNEHGLKVLAPIETEEMDIDGTTIEVIDGDKINGFVQTTVEEGIMDVAKGAVGMVKDVISKEKEYQAQKQKKAGEVVRKLRKEESLSEEPTNDEFTKEYEDQKASFEGKKKQPKVAAGKTTGVKEMPESFQQIDERELTKGEAKKKEDYVMGMKKKLSGFKQRYGERAKSVMYATATKMAKKD